MKVIYLYTTLQVITFCFPSCEKLHPPVIQVQHVSFKYQEDKVMYFIPDCKILIGNIVYENEIFPYPLNNRYFYYSKQAFYELV